MTQSQIELARTFLFVPSNRPERYAKALASGADLVIVDLEDAIAPSDKPAARLALQQAWPSFNAQDRERLLVRINASDSPWHSDDVLLLAELKPAAIVLPKTESAEQLQALAKALPCPVIALIESALGLLNVNVIAASAQVVRLAMGHIDLQVDLGMQCGPEENELQPARFALVLASRLAGLAPPIDGVTVRTDDAEQMRTDTLRGKRMGYAARLCIHPSQVEVAHTTLAPSAQELDWARRVVAADQTAQGAAIKLDGRMIDRPVVLLAQRTLALAG